jgi:hypothetical protein
MEGENMCRSLRVILVAGSFLLLGIVVGSAPVQAQVMIDDFEAGQTPLQVVWTEDYGVSSAAVPVLGGERDFQVEIYAGVTGFAQAEATGGAYIHTISGVAIVARTTVIWDGPDGDGDNVDGSGLGGLNFTSQGLDRFRIHVLDASQDWIVGIRVYSADNLYSGATINVDASVAGEDVFLPFDLFGEEADADGPADFSNVGAIALAIGFEGLGATGTVRLGEFEASMDSQIPEDTYTYWVPVAAHAQGAGGSQWRSDMGGLNLSAAEASLTIRLHTSNTTHEGEFALPGDGHLIFSDIVGQLAEGNKQGTLEIESDSELFVTSRTYNQSTNGTFGQYLDGAPSDQGLSTGERAWLPHLIQGTLQNGQSFRTNIGVANTGDRNSSVEITLHDEMGTEVARFNLGVEAAQVVQENEVFSNRAGLDTVPQGYAIVEIIDGTGIFVYGSVIDNGTGDATTIPMKVR